MFGEMMRSYCAVPTRSNQKYIPAKPAWSGSNKSSTFTSNYLLAVNSCVCESGCPKCAVNHQLEKQASLHATQNILNNECLDVKSDQVKIHTDEKAAFWANHFHAKAFTVGNDIYFNQGYYQPDTLKGKRLLAHEFAHVRQQRAMNESLVQCEELDECGKDYEVIDYKRYFNYETDLITNADLLFEEIIYDWEKLEQVRVDAETGDPVAARLYLHIQSTFHHFGKMLADKQATPMCKFLGPENALCRLDEKQLEKIRDDTPSGALLREWMATGYIVQAQKHNFTWTVIGNVAMFIVAGAALKSVLVQEAVAGGGSSGGSGGRVGGTGGELVQLPTKTAPITSGGARPAASRSGKDIYVGTSEPAFKYTPAEVPAVQPAIIPEVEPAILPNPKIIPFPQSTPIATESAAPSAMSSNYPAMAAMLALHPDARQCIQEEDKEEKKEKCFISEAAPRGGNDEHDAFAMSVTGSPVEYLLTSEEGEKYQYDGMDAGQTLYEVKTRHQFLKIIGQPDIPSWSPRQTLAISGSVSSLREQIRRAQRIANSCGYEFRMAVNDYDVCLLMRELLGDIIYSPDYIEFWPFIY